jgi:hypothetical protein
MLARREAEEGRELAPLAKALTSRTVARIALPITGPTPGIVISRRAFGSAFACAASSASIAAMAPSSASICEASGASAARTPSGSAISPFSSTLSASKWTSAGG